MFKSKSFDSIFDKFSVNICEESQSFNNFNVLNLQGAQKYLSYGEFMMKNKSKKTSKSKRQKVIYYYYKNLLSNL